ncbi:MAG: beta-mannosidase, partial [Lachnospiraceae bacterium]|nr:beta-mannosidase [Lachnospiraceae bacterium]
MSMQLPVNRNASRGARELLVYLEEQAGKRIITGQHTQTVQMEEIGHIRRVTGKEPKLRGFELLAYSPNINYEDAGSECLTEVEENKNTLEEAMRFALESDGILTFSFHWFSPLGGRDKSFYSRNTDFDPEKVLIPGSREREAFFHDLDVIAELLIPFREKDIPVLWRPFHEAEGDWFWWGAKGTEVAGELFKLMYDRFVGK